jgi:hypothetical protein
MPAKNPSAKLKKRKSIQPRKGVDRDYGRALMAGEGHEYDDDLFDYNDAASNFSLLSEDADESSELH